MVLRGDQQPDHPIPADGTKQTNFAPTIRLGMVRIFLALLCTIGMCLNSIDVKSAFCQTPLPTDYPPTYVRFPKGTPEYLLGQLYLLICSLYGLRDAPRLWYLFWIAILRRLRFIQSRIDPCLWIRDQGTLEQILLLFWVDDSLVGTHTQEIFDLFFAEIFAIISVTCSNPKATEFTFIGLTIRYNISKKTVHISQTKFINACLQRFGLSEANPTVIPMASDTRITPATPEEVVPVVLIRQMQAMVGSLIYVEQATRPDISFAVSQVARVMGAPTTIHMGLVKQILRYLSGTKTLGLTYGPPLPSTLIPGFQSSLATYADASLGGPHTKGKSTTGVLVCHHGSPVMWTSHMQSVVALSTFESEFMATATGVQYTLYTRNAYAELLFPQIDPTKVYSDNQPNVDAVNNQSSSPRSRHIDLRFHFIIDEVLKKKIAVIHIPGTDNPSDICTKPLPAPKFLQFRNALMRIA